MGTRFQAHSKNSQRIRSFSPPNLGNSDYLPGRNGITKVTLMTLFRTLAICASMAVLGTTTTAVAAAADENAIAQDIASTMEKFYGQPIENADSFLAKKFGIKGPMKQDGSSFVYMLPASNPICGELKVDVDNNAIRSWQTITWQRTEDHQPGRACDQAFKEKLGSL